MVIFNSVSDYASKNRPSAVALGFFDGVHLGHKQVISTCRQNRGELECTVLTFRTSPSEAFNINTPLLTDNEDKAKLIEKYGADALIFSDFLKLKDMDPEDFIHNVLLKKLHAKKIFCGFNYLFGKNGTGNTDLLKTICEKEDVSVTVCEPIYCNNDIISSTKIRNLILSGRIKDANRMLGYSFKICGKVEEGLHNGKSLSFPTINIPLKVGIIKPKFGVYRSEVTIKNKKYIGATNIGMHPTLGKVSPLCETNIISYEGEPLYNEFASVALLDFIREEKIFTSKEELCAQIKKDKEKIIKDSNMI